MPKLDKEVYFVVYKNSAWVTAPRLVKANWETEKSFGVRGISIEGVRTTFSTGEMYKKAEWKYKRFRTVFAARSFLNNLQKYVDRIETLKELIREEKKLIESKFE